MSSFNSQIDLITEKEMVYDIVSRLTLGNNFINGDYNSAVNATDKSVLFAAGTKLENVLGQIIKALPTTDIHNLDKLKTVYTQCNVGTTRVRIPIPDSHRLYKVVQESMNIDVTSCFSRNGDVYEAVFAAPTNTIETYKGFFIR